MTGGAARLAGVSVRGGVLTASVGLAVALLLGRATGLVRESIIAARFGLSNEGDAAAVLLSLPDILVSLLMAGGMSAALVPRLANAADAEAAALVRFVAGISLIIFGALGLVLLFLPELIFGIFAPGSLAVAQAPSALALGTTAAALPVVALSGVTGAWLNAKGRYWAVGLGTLLFNCGVIGALLGWDWGASPLAVLGCGVLAGSLLRWSVQLPGLPWRSLIDRVERPETKRAFFAAFLAGLGATTVTLLPPIVLRAMASFLGEGSLVGLYYAQKLVELPVGVVLSSLSTVALTALSTSFREHGLPRARYEAAVHLRRASLLGLIVAIFGAGMAWQIVEVVFGHGRIGPEGVATIAGQFAIGIFALPFAALALIGGNFLYATRQPRAAILPAICGLAATALCAVPALTYGDPRYLMVAAVAGQAVLALGVVARGGLLFRRVAPGASGGTIGSWLVRALQATIPLALALWLAAIASPAGAMVQLAIAGVGLAIAGAIVVWRDARA